MGSRYKLESPRETGEGEGRGSPRTASTSQLDSVRREAPQAIYISAKRGLCWTTYLKILKVRTKFGNHVLNIYALLNNGAEGSLIREDFVTGMGKSVTNALINFVTFHGSDPLLPSRKVEFELLAPHNDSNRFEVTVDNTPFCKLHRVAGRLFRRLMIGTIWRECRIWMWITGR